MFRVLHKRFLFLSFLFVTNLFFIPFCHAQTIYSNGFEGTAIAGTTSFTGGATGDPNLNIASSAWSTSGVYTTFTGNAPTTPTSMALQPATATTTTWTLTIPVSAGYTANITGLQFDYRSTSTSYNTMSISINGTTVYTNSSLNTASAWVTVPVTGLTLPGITGTITVVSVMSGGSHGGTSTFRYDNFSLTGTVVNNHPPSFAGGSPQVMTVCENSGATSINSLMAINDIDVGQTETWTVITAPAHGTLGGFPGTAISTGSTVTPSGMTYTPTPGYSGSDNYTIQVSDGAATATTTINVTVDTAPNVYTITGGGGYCTGGTGVHIGLSNSDNSITYKLYNTTGLVNTLTGTGSALDFGPQTTAGTYTVVATDPGTGCSSDMDYFSGSGVVVVNPLPNIYNVTGGGISCGSTGVHIVLSGSDNGVNYQLYAGAGLYATITGTGSSIDFGSISTAGTYSVLAVNATTGCMNSMTGSATVSVTTPVIPSVNINVSTGDTVCAGTAPVFTAMPVNGGPTPSYTWRVNGGAAGTGSTYTYAPANGDTVTVKLASSLACVLPDTALHTVVMTVHASVVPYVNVSVNPSNLVCEGEHVTYTALSVYGGIAPVYTWLKNGVSVGSGPAYSDVPANGDNIYCRMVSNYGCVLADTVLSGLVHMTVTPLLIPSVYITANPGPVIAIGQQVTLTAHVSGSGGTSLSYQWLINGIPVFGDNTDQLVSNALGYPSEDSVTCIVTSNGGVCGPQASFDWMYIVAYPESVSNVSSINDNITVIPNPSRGAFTIRGTFDAINASEDVEIIVADMVGNTIYAGSTKTNNGYLETQVQLSDAVANGIYILSMRTVGMSKNVRILITR